MCDVVLKAIFNGDILPWEQKISRSPVYKELSKKIEKEREFFMRDMSKEEKNRFDDYHCLLMERNSEEFNNCMFQNFMLGISVGMEIIEGKQKIIEDYGV